jgi:nitrite reductase (NO-forming)
MKITRPIQLLAILALGVLGVATASVVAQAGTAKTTINVTEREFSIKLSARKAPVGVVRFVIRNRGLYPHALSVKQGSVSKRTPLIKPGKTATLIVRLTKGKLSLWCPVPGHAARGMKATLAVGAVTAVSSTTTTTDDTTTTTTYNPPGY